MEPEDRQSNPYCTPVVGEPFDKLPVTSYGTARWTVTRNVMGFDDSLAETYTWAVNDSAWKGKAKYAVLCEKISAQEQWDSGYHYWTMTFGFHVDSRRKWQPVQVPSKGYGYLDWVGAAATEPDPKGSRLVYVNADGDGTDVPFYLPRYPFDEADFSVLPL